MIRGAVFDVDGTLLDSMPVWRDAGARYLKSLGITPEPGLGETLFPMSFEEGAAYLKWQYGLEQAAGEIQAGISDIIGDFYRDEAALKPGAAAGFLVAAVEDAESAADRAGIQSCAHWYMKDFIHFDDFWRFATGN